MQLKAEEITPQAGVGLSADYLSLCVTFIATLLNTGSTATVALLRDGIELVVASVGDSRALLCRKGKAEKLTIDHTPERKDEKERYLCKMCNFGLNFFFPSQF